MDTSKQELLVLFLIGGIMGTTGGLVMGVKSQHETDQADVKNIPGRILDGTTPIPPVSKKELAEIAADKPEAWDRLQKMKKWVAEVEALAAEQRAAKNSSWQDRLNGRAAESAADIEAAVAEQKAAPRQSLTSGKGREERGKLDNAHVAARQKQLEDVLNPSPVQYEVRGKIVQLQPVPKWVAIRLDGKPTNEKGTKLARVLTPAALETIAEQSHVISKEEGGKVIALVPRSALKDKQELLNAASSYDCVPDLTAVYESSGLLVVPHRTIFSRVKSPKDEQALLKVAEDLGLRKIESNSGKVRFEFTDRANFANVFDAAQALVQSGLVSWSEPEFIREIRYYPAENSTWQERLDGREAETNNSQIIKVY